jgi:hypothetical protein
MAGHGEAFRSDQNTQNVVGIQRYPAAGREKGAAVQLGR